MTITQQNPAPPQGTISDADAVADEIRRTGVICVDLDGTLARNDAFADATIVHLGSGARGIIQVARAVLSGRAQAKLRIGELQPYDVELQPYNTPLIDWLRAWKARGVRIVLATAADRSIAEAVAKHLGIFDEILASDGTHNLKGENKARALVEKYGERGFVYAGDSVADLEVWSSAAAAVAVNAPASVRRRLEATALPVLQIGPRQRRAEWMALLTAMRPYQWCKNLLVFVPILAAGAFTNVTSWTLSLLAFIAFSLTASGVYLINDAFDLRVDRQHPRKRDRPFASGQLPIAYVLLVVPIFILGGGFALAAGIFPEILIYIILTSFYSLYGKRKVILDVVLLALLYSIRLYAGGEATGYGASPWLLAFSGFLFFNLAIMKRYGEIEGSDKDGLSGRGYLKTDLVFLLAAGMASGFSACVVLALYVENSLDAGRYAMPVFLWALAPLMLIWQLRLWRETVQGRMTDDPIIFAARDKATLLIGAAAILFVLLANASRI